MCLRVRCVLLQYWAKNTKMYFIEILSQTIQPEDLILMGVLIWYFVLCWNVFCKEYVWVASLLVLNQYECCFSNVTVILYIFCFVVSCSIRGIFFIGIIIFWYCRESVDVVPTLSLLLIVVSHVWLLLFLFMIWEYFTGALCRFILFIIFTYRGIFWICKSVLVVVFLFVVYIVELLI